MLKEFMLLSIMMYLSGSSLASEVNKPIDSMLPFPVTIDFSGNVSWGYPINFGGMDMGNMSMGGMNSDSGSMSDNQMGGMNSDSGSMNDETPMSANHMSSGWHYMVMPMLTLGGDSYRRLISKSKSSLIAHNDESSGFYAVENKNIIYGGGAGVMAMPPDGIPMLSLRLSLMPYKGGHVFKLKQVDSRKDLSQVDSMLIPNDLNDLNDWRTGDRMSYSARGGVMFGAGIGYSIFAAVMGTYMAEGSWTVSVSKADETTVFLTVKKDKMKMMARRVLNALVDVSASQMQTFSGEFQFLIDLSTEEGEESYRRI